MRYNFNDIPTGKGIRCILHQSPPLANQIQPGRKLRPSATSLHRLTERARRLYEQGASLTRLRQYVSRWHLWLMGGLDDLVSKKGGSTRYWVYVLKHLHITGATVRT